jgi:glycosyltransferase involved in cell wall biosynthesis
MSDRVVVAVEQLRRRVPGGIGRYTQGLLRGLRDLGGQSVVLVASRHLGAGPDPLGAWGFPVRASALPAPLLTAAWDRGLAPVRRADLVHAVSLAAPPVRPAHRQGGPALVVTVHDLAWRAHPEATTARGRRWHEAALRKALEKADAFVVPSAVVADALVAAGADRGRVQVIAHGVDHLPPTDAPRARALLQHLGVADGYLLAVATLEPRKNLRRLVAAFERARLSFPEPWPLVVVGPRGWGDAGLEHIRREGVVAAGAVDDAVLAALYAGARAFAYVALEEGFGLPPLEAMACGVPVVVSRTVPAVTAPSGSLTVPPGALTVPPGAVTAPSGSLTVPPGAVTAPSGSLTAPSGSVTAPPGAATAPLGPVTSPAGSRSRSSAGTAQVALQVDPLTVESIADALVRAASDEALRGLLAANGRAFTAPLTWKASAKAHVEWWAHVR